jgi:lipid-A-disaccharide synthase
MERLSVMGLAEVLRHLPELLRIRRSSRGASRHCGRTSWSASIPRISPWVSSVACARRDPHRALRQSLDLGLAAGAVHGIGRAADHVLCLLPFEPELYEAHGHPGFVSSGTRWPMPSRSCRTGRPRGAGHLRAAGAGTLVALLPGSRMGEVERLGGEFAAAAALLAARHPGLRFIAAMASHGDPRASRRSWRARAGLRCSWWTDALREVMAAADLVILASGTATLEAALLKRPWWSPTASRR